MSEPFLILHRVRGEPAFDIAEKIECQHCKPENDCGCNWCRSDRSEPCGMCEGQGHWWIIPTSGHRAYPFETWAIHELKHEPDSRWQPGFLLPILCGKDYVIAPIPDNWPDHYACNDRPTASTAEHKSFAKGLLEKLGLVKPTRVERRF